jgi:cytochrome c oxidase assembly protein subunit 15
MARATAAVVYLQIILGAAVRHTGAALLIPDFPLSLGRVIPPLNSWPIALNFAHRAGATLVAVLVIALVVRIVRDHRAEPWLRRPAVALLVLIALQIALGAATVLTGKAVTPTTAHVAAGALIWVTSVMLAVRSRRVAGAAATESAALPFVAEPAAR